MAKQSRRTAVGVAIGKRIPDSRVARKIQKRWPSGRKGFATNMAIGTAFGIGTGTVIGRKITKGR